MRPWLFQLPLSIPPDARETMEMCAYNRSTTAFIDLMWANRVAEHPPVQRAISKSWPPTIYDKDQRGYILSPLVSNVTQLRPKP